MNTTGSNRLWWFVNVPVSIKGIFQTINPWESSVWENLVPLNHDFSHLRLMKMPSQWKCSFKRSINCTFSLALVSSGEPFPENGRSPGSTQHSSPRSDFNSRMFCNNSAPSQNSAPSTTGSSPPDTVANQNLQPSDVTIQRKESEGFGFVIISSLNRPETVAAAGKEWLFCTLHALQLIFYLGHSSTVIAHSGWLLQRVIVILKVQHVLINLCFNNRCTSIWGLKRLVTVF